VNAIVKDVMSTHVIAVRQDATFKEMASRLREQRVSVFSRPDADIRHEITIEGAPETTAVGRDIIETVRHVEGVVAVRDRLTYQHP
jgi:hypothetical protein